MGGPIDLATGRPMAASVLVVEDVEATRFAVCRALTRAGFSVFEARTGAEGLGLVAREHVDIVVLDVHLPDISGFEVRRRIKENPATTRIPVLHLSATVLDPKQRAEALEGGADAFLSHPVESDELVAVLRALLRMHELERQLDIAEGRWQQTFRGAQIGMALVGLDGHFLLVNDRFAAMLGRPASELRNRPILTVVQAEDVGAVARALAEVAASGREVTLAARHIRSGSGGDAEVDVSLSLVRAPDGSPLHLLEQVTDVTRQRRAERLLRQANERYRDPLLSSPAGQFVAELDGTLVDANPAFRGLTGRYDGGSSPASLADCVLEEDRPLLDSRIRALSETGGSTRTDLRLQRPDGSLLDVAVVIATMRDPGAGRARLIGSVHDVAERKRAERALAVSEQRFSSAFEDAPIGMALVSTGASGEVPVDKPNRSLCALLGQTQAELTGTDLLLQVHPEDQQVFRRLVRAVAEDQPVASIEVRLADTVGGHLWAIMSVSRIATGDGERRLLVHVLDVTARKRAEDLLSHRALHDQLTGLPNRTLLGDRIQHALARAQRSDTQMAVLFLDLDNFKVLNDSLGHEAGDQLLIGVATALRNVVREGDTAARLGGDEFVVLCEELQDQQEAARVAERVAAVISEPLAVQGTEISISASIGIALASPDHDTPEQLLRDADLAMYEAKRRGPNHWEMFDESLRVRAHLRLRTEIDLRSAVKRRELDVYYQPILHLGSGRIVGLEALLRWRHPSRGLLNPEDFLDVAEESGLIVPIGADCLAEACAQLAAWRSRRNCQDLQMSVNLSLKQLMHHGAFGRGLAATLEETGLDPAALHLEITETVLPEAALLISRELADVATQGVILGVDDFGTGYSSLVQLRQLPVQFVKIDRSFVQGLPHSAQDVAIVESVVRLGQALRLQTIAEGVERRDQLQVLRDLGCEFAQGFYFHAPQPASVIEELLDAADPESGRNLVDQSR